MMWSAAESNLSTEYCGHTADIQWRLCLSTCSQDIQYMTMNQIHCMSLHGSLYTPTCTQLLQHRHKHSC